jgi:V/A-type H+-transporting ATPase subunit E
MNTKLQELTDKIYNEGVEKAREEARLIIESAENQAVDIVAKAEAKASQLLSGAEARSSELSKNTRSELQLFAQQSVNALKTEITNLIAGKIVSDSVKAATADKTFMQQAILKLVEQWAQNQQVVIQTADAKALTAYFEANAKALLNKGVTIEQANEVKAGFNIIPEKEGYKISLGEEEFIAYFKEFLRPALIEMLF